MRWSPTRLAGVLEFGATADLKAELLDKLRNEAKVI